MKGLKEQQRRGSRKSLEKRESVPLTGAHSHPETERSFPKILTSAELHLGPFQSPASVWQEPRGAKVTLSTGGACSCGEL